MKHHTQHYLEKTSDLAGGFESGPNIERTDKNFSVKEIFTVNDTETKLGHGQKIKIRSIVSGDSATPQVLLDDFIVGVADVVVSRTVTLPNPSLAGFGKIYIIKDISGSATTTTIAISPYASETIDGDTSSGITSNFGVKRLFTNGTNWFTY